MNIDSKSGLPDFRRIFESMVGSVSILSTDYRFLAVTDVWLRDVRKTRDEVLGRPLFEVFPGDPNDPDRGGPDNLKRSLDRVLADGVPDTMPVLKYEIAAPGGEGRFEEKYWSVTNTPIFGEHGEILFINNAAEDVTEFVLRTKRSQEQEKASAELESRVGRMEAEILRRTAELEQQRRAAEVLREGMHRFHLMTNAAPSLVWTSGVSSFCDYFNEAWLRFTGRTMAQELGNGWIQGIHPEDAGKCYGAYRKAFDERQSFEMEYRLRRHDGEYRWFLSRGVPRYSLDSVFEGYIGTCTDIQRLKDAEAALEASEQRYRSLVSATSTVVWITDALGMFSGRQPSWESYTGQAWEDYRGRGGMDALHPDDRERVNRHWAEAVDARSPFESEYRCWHAATRQYRSVIARGVPIHNPDGSVREWVGTLSDIHDQKHLEEHLRHTAKLESLGVLAGGVAHDFNNLLVGILGNASLALEIVSGSSPVRGMLQDVVDASERAANLTKQLLAYAGKGRFVIAPIDLSQLVDEISNLIRASVPPHVQFRLDLAKGIAFVEGDSAQLQQVIMNLVINGAEAIEEGKPGIVLVTVKEQEVDEFYLAQAFAGEKIKPGRYVSLEVHDNGSGMDEAIMTRMFEPFFTTKFTGRGLGLAAVLGIVRGHGGALKVYSTPGNGTTFKVLWPASPEIGRSEERILPVPDTTDTGTVLVIDDEELIRKTLKSTLERYGFQVILAENGGEGVDLFRAIGHKVSVVILDMTMPVISGEETFRRLKSIRPNVRVVLSSGYNEVETVQRFTGKDLAGFLQKPYTAETLIARVRETMLSQPAERPLSS